MQWVVTNRRVWAALAAFLVAVSVGAAADEESPAADARSHATRAADESMVRWSDYVELPRPVEDDASPWIDFVVTSGVFNLARPDLGDLRLVDATGIEVPYALRIRRPQFGDEAVAAKEFNRVADLAGSSELSLDLGENPPEHNQVDVPLPGVNFRRRVVLDGSDDGIIWRQLADQNLISFQRGSRTLGDGQLTYSPSRYRYLRVRVERDPVVDQGGVKIGDVTVHRRVEIPGELLTLSATLGSQMPVRANGGPGSAWMIDLGADNMPCESLHLDINDPVFDRDYLIEAAPSNDVDATFTWAGAGRLRRQPGTPVKPIEVSFGEVTARRLRLTVTDYRNPPLDIRFAEFQSAAREVIFERSETHGWPLRLYFGNALAELPHYDLERNLPARLEPAPARITPGEPEANPSYEPEPLPLGERLPWLVYVVLGGACLVLAAVLLNLGRMAVAMHDHEQHEPAAS